MIDQYEKNETDMIMIMINVPIKNVDQMFHIGIDHVSAILFINGCLIKNMFDQQSQNVSNNNNDDKICLSLCV